MASSPARPAARSLTGPAAPGRVVSRPSAASVATVADLAVSLAPRVDVLTDRLVEALFESDEAYREQRLVPLDELRASCRANLLEALNALAQLPERDAGLLEHARRTGRRRADQGLPLENLLHAFRLGGRILWEGLLEECRARPRPPLDELTEGAVLVWDVNDIHSWEVAEAYREAEELVLSRQASRRQTLLHSMLSGLAGEEDAVFAAEVLDLPETGSYVIAVADVRGTAAPSARALAGLLAGRGLRSEWVRRSDRLAGLIGLRGQPVATLVEWLAGAGDLRLGLSPAIAELTQVATAYRQAELALRSIPAHRAEVATLDDRLTNALLAASPDLARRLAQRLLGPVYAASPAEREVLLRTLRAYIAARGGVAAVARGLSCHRNTVFNRLARIHDLTGLAPGDPLDLGQLALALLAVDLLGIEPDLVES